MKFSFEFKFSLINLFLIFLLVFYFYHFLKKEYDIYSLRDSQFRDITEKLIKNNYKYSLLYKKSRLYIVQKKDNNQSSQSTVYVPSESSVNLIQVSSTTSNSTPKPNIVNEVIKVSTDTYVIIKKGGFCFSPSLNLLINSKTSFGIGSRFIYYNNYGIGVGISSHLSMYTYFDIKLDRIFPIFSNTSIGLYYDVIRNSSQPNLGLILNVYF
jgi:hypothetical protein